MLDENTGSGSPQNDSAPARADEALLNPANQPAGSDGQPSAGSDRPDGVERTAEPAATNWEQRAKDSQRALSERENRLQRLEAQNELLQRLATGQRGQSEQDVQAEIAALEEKIRNDPAEAVRYTHKVLAMRDQHYEVQRAQDRADFERQMLELNPETRGLQDALKVVQDIPTFAGLPLRDQIEVARRFKASGSGVQARPPGGVGLQRPAPASQKPQTGKERFAAYLAASGATKPNVPKGVVQFEMSRGK